MTDNDDCCCCDPVGIARRDVVMGGAALGLVSALPGGVLAADSPTRTLTEIGNGIYRSQNNRHYGLVVDTKDGVVVFDTINKDMARWLDTEIAKRLKKPVRYVVYSHNHADHTSGGEVFAHHNPTYVSHRLARDSHIRMGAATRPADQTFERAHTIRLGGRDIELRYHGPNDGRGSISLLVPDERLLSVVDWLVIGRLPYRELNRYDLDGTIASLRDLEHLDWKLASPGHADIGDKQGALIERRYLELLRDATLAEIAERTPLDKTAAAVRAKLASVPEFKALKQFDAWVEENIRGAHFQYSRIEGFADGVLPDPAYASR